MWWMTEGQLDFVMEIDTKDIANKYDVTVETAYDI